MWSNSVNEYEIERDKILLTHGQIGCFLFTRMNLLQPNFKKIVLEMLQDFINIIYPEKLNLIRNGPNANYYKSNTSKNFDNFKKDFKEFEYKKNYNPSKNIFNLNYEIDLKNGCDKKNTIGDFRFHANINGVINDKKANARDVYCHEIGIFVPKNFDKINEIIKLVKKYYFLLECCYGYINPVIAYNKAKLYPVVSRILENYANKKNTIFDIPDNSGNSEYFESKIKGAQWGNFLSEKHIEHLGGKEKIKAELKDYIVEDLPDNSLFVRMPFETPTEENKKFVKYYEILSELLKPIFIPKWNQSEVALRLGTPNTGDKFLRRFL